MVRTKKRISKAPGQQKTTITQLCGGKWAAQVYQAHLDACAKLKEGQEKFLVARSYNYFYRLLMQRGGAIIGAVGAVDKLGGFCAVVKTQNFLRAQGAGIITFPDSDFIVKAGLHDAPAWIIQSLCTLDHARGKQLSRSIVGQAVKWCAEQICGGKGHIFAEVDLSNMCSMNKFLQNGFEPIAVWTAREANGKTRQKVLLHHLSKEQRQELLKNTTSLFLDQEVPLFTEEGGSLLFGQAVANHLKAGRRLIIRPGYEKTRYVQLAVIDGPK